jgi:hypothetical protein
VLSGNPGITPQLRMRSVKQRSITIGGQKCKFLKYEVRQQQAAEGQLRGS